jgi:hypothetical protein
VDERLSSWAQRGAQWAASHPARGRDVAGAEVLIIANHHQARAELELALPYTVSTRSVDGASDTEGIGTQVVVIGGPFPLAELVEVRAHPRLFDKPVVLFAPGKDLPEMDWPSMHVWPVVSEQDPTRQVVQHVQQLLAATGSDDLEAEGIGFSDVSPPRDRCHDID